ncbi:MAG: multicopper oxidase domain-containing protein [Bacteroidetes bacterium]|nr:multicopper oxidase domain-containing protein [Bacteroidota bacterium]
MRYFLLHIILAAGLAGYSQTKIVHLAAEMNETHFLDGGGSVEMWGYGIIKPSGAYQAQLPGPVLEFNLGDTVEIHFHNMSPEDHTIHLHGLDVSTSEDGVPATSPAVDPWDSTVYHFVAKNTGSFLYHCHVLTTLHLTMGMYGVIVVKNFPEQNLIYPGGPSYQNEFVFLATDMDKSLNENPLSPGPLNLLVMDYFMINGLSGNSLTTDPDHQVTAYPGDSVLLRLSSMGYSKTRYIFPEELNAIAYLSDGRILPVPYACDTLFVFPGERYEVLLTPTAVTDVDIQVGYFESRNDQLLYTNYISVNGDVGLQTKLQTAFKYYPNPVNDQLSFSTENPGSMLRIMNLSGQLVLEKQIVNHNTLLDLSSLSKGIYLLTYDGISQKIVKL